MDQRSIKRKDMYLGGFDSELHETSIQKITKKLNMNDK